MFWKLELKFILASYNFCFKNTMLNIFNTGNYFILFSESILPSIQVLLLTDQLTRLEVIESMFQVSNGVII